MLSLNLISHLDDLPHARGDEPWGGKIPAKVTLPLHDISPTFVGMNHMRSAP